MTQVSAQTILGIRAALLHSPFVVDFDAVYTRVQYRTPFHEGTSHSISRAHGVVACGAEGVRDGLEDNVRAAYLLPNDAPIDLVGLKFARTQEQAIATVTRGVMGASVEQALNSVEDGILIGDVVKRGGSVVSMMFHELDRKPVFGLKALRTLHMSRMGLPASAFFSGWCEINVLDTLVCLTGFHSEMSNSANGVSRQSSMLLVVDGDDGLERAHLRCLDRVPGAQFEWEVLLNGVGLISVLAARMRMGTEKATLSYAIEQALRDLRAGRPPTVNSWRRIYREACEKALTIGHECPYEINNPSVPWIPTREEALSVASLSKIIVPIPTPDTAEECVLSYANWEPDNTCGVKFLGNYVKALRRNLKPAKRMKLTTQADLYSLRSGISGDAVIMFGLREIRNHWTSDYDTPILNAAFKNHPPSKPTLDDLLAYEKAMNVAVCRAFLREYEVIDRHCTTCNGKGCVNKSMHPVYCMVRVVRRGDKVRFPANTDPMITYILGMVSNSHRAAMTGMNVGTRAMTGRSEFLKLAYELSPDHSWCAYSSDAADSTGHRPEPIMKEIAELGMCFGPDQFDFPEGHHAVQMAFRISTCARVISPCRLKPMTTAAAPKEFVGAAAEKSVVSAFGAGISFRPRVRFTAQLRARIPISSPPGYLEQLCLTLASNPQASNLAPYYLRHALSLSDGGLFVLTTAVASGKTVFALQVASCVGELLYVSPQRSLAENVEASTEALSQVIGNTFIQRNGKCDIEIKRLGVRSNPRFARIRSYMEYYVCWWIETRSTPLIVVIDEAGMDSVRRVIIIATALRNPMITLLCMGAGMPNVNLYLGLGFTELYSPLVKARHERILRECTYDQLVDKITESVHELNMANGGRILVYFPFVSHCEKFVKRILHLNVPIGQLHGKASEANRMLALSRDHRLGIIVGNVSMAYGLNLPGASFVYFVDGAINHGICMATGAHVGIVTRMKADQRNQLLGRCGRDISDHCNVVTEVFGFPIHVSDHKGEGIMHGRDLARVTADANKRLRTPLTIDSVYNAMGGVPNYNEQIEIHRTLQFYVPSDGFSPGGSLWNSLVREKFFNVPSQDKLWTALVAFYVDQGPISRVTTDIEDLASTQVDPRFVMQTREGNRLRPIEKNACVRLSVWNIVFGLETDVGGRRALQHDFMTKAVGAFTISDAIAREWMSQQPPDKIDYFPEFAMGCAQFLAVIRTDGAAKMLFYDVAHQIDVDLAPGTVVALPNYSYVVTSKGVASRMGILLQVFKPDHIDESVMNILWAKDANVRSSTLLFPTLEVQSIQITQESILNPQRACILFSSHFMRSTLSLDESIDRFTEEISDAQSAMREAGTMTRPFQDLGTKNLFFVLMQLTAGMGNKKLLLECMEHFETLRESLPPRLRTVSAERIRLCKEALLASSPEIYLEVYGDDALGLMVDVVLIASRLYCFMIGQHEHAVSEVGKASKSVVSLFVNQVAYCSYTSRMHVTEKAYGNSVRFQEVVGARIGTLYYGLGKVIAGLAGIRSPHSVLTSWNCVETYGKESSLREKTWARNLLMLHHELTEFFDMSPNDQVLYERASGPIQNQRQRRAVWDAVKRHFVNHCSITEFENPPDGYVALGSLHPASTEEDVDEMGSNSAPDTPILSTFGRCMAWYVPHENTKVKYPTRGEIKARMVVRSVLCVLKSDVEAFERKYMKWMDTSRNQLN